MVTIDSMLSVCPRGAWVTETRATQLLGLSKAALKEEKSKGSLKHVHVEHGRRCYVHKPFSQHRFFFVQNQSSPTGSPNLSLTEWVSICLALESGDLSSVDSETVQLISLYTNRTISDEDTSSLEKARSDLQSVEAIITAGQLSSEPVESAADDDYTYPPQKASATSDSSSSEIYTRADGKKVRRVKRATSAGAASSLSGFLAGGSGAAKGESKLSKLSGSKSVVGDGEIYVRPDGKKVRRIKKPSASGASVEGEPPKSDSLSGFLDSRPAKKKTGSASVAGDQLAVDKSASLTGEIYIRADGKKVRRVKKAPAATDDNSNVEIITRPDGTKVRRIKKLKPPEEKSKDAEAKAKEAPNSGLAGFLDKGVAGKPAKFSGSHSVAGDQIVRSNTASLDGEIYIRADGKKVRRVKKTKPNEESKPAAPSNSLSALLDAGSKDKIKHSGAATVTGEMQPKKEEFEIFVKPDGTKVRRIRRTAPLAAPAGTGEKKSLGGFLENNVSSKPKRTGSASVAGDQLAVDKSDSLTGEIYIRADGKKVRRVKKPSGPAGENVEIITKPDGTKVRRIRRGPAKPKEEKPAETKAATPSDKEKGLSSFLGAQPKAAAKGSSATVGGDRPTVSPALPKPLSTKEEMEAEKAKLLANMGTKGDTPKKSLDGFLGGMDGKPKKRGGSASVAGDQLAVSKSSSLTGEVYVRSDGKKVRRVKKSAAEPGDEVEIITRPDGTKVRRIKRAKKPIEASSPAPAAAQKGTKAPVEAKKSSLDGFLIPKTGDQAAKDTTGSASVFGDQLHAGSEEGEVYIREDGKKVRRIKKTPATAIGPDDKYEIFVRPDGKKVRRVRRATKSSDADPAKPSSAEPRGGNTWRQAEIVAFEDKPPRVTEEKPSIATPPASNEDTSKQPAPPAVKSPTVADKTVANEPKAESKKATPESSAKEEKTIEKIAPKAPTPSQPEKEVTAPKVEKPEVSATTPGPPPKTVPKETVAVSKEQAKTTLSDGMVAIPKEQAEKTVPEGMVAIPKEQAQKSLPEGMVAIPKEQAERFLPEGMVALSKEQAKNILPEGMVAVSKEHAKRFLPEGMVAVPEEQAKNTLPEGMVAVPKDQYLAEGMVAVPRELAEKTVPEGMIAIPKEKAGGGEIPEGYVLVPKDRVRGDPTKDELVMVPADQVKDDNDNAGSSNEDYEKNIVSMEDISLRMEEYKKGGAGAGGARFLLQPLPEDKLLRDDFIKKNLLPKEAAAPAPAPPPAPAPAPPPKPAEPSQGIAELLAKMSTMENFDGEKMGELLQKLQEAEKRQKKLEKQLAQAGVAIAEDIDYDVALKKVEEIAKRMGEIGGSDVQHPDKEEQNKLREEYFKLEQEMEKYNSALMLTDEYQAEQDRLEQKWEDDNAPGNLEALKKLRRHMPVEVRNMSEAQLTNEPTPNGKYLPKATAKKFKRTNVLQIIRRNPDDLVRMHPSTLENMRVTGLTLTERRAIYEHLRPVGPQWKAMKAEKMTERKWTWYSMMKSNFKENLASWQRHVDQYGPPGAHPYATRANPNEGCPLIGKQCPLKADKLIDYDGDYGYPDTAEYEVSEVRKADVDDPGAKAMQEALELMKEKKANERGEALKKHYKGKLLMVSKANGSCESMDEAMDKMEYGMAKWLDDIVRMGDDKSKLTDDVKKKEVANITDVLNEVKLLVLNFCERSGMQMSGKKKAGDDKPDIRSAVECSLAEEVYELFEVFTKFVSNRLKTLEVVDTRLRSTSDMLMGLLKELHERNVNTLKALGVERADRSRKLKTEEEIVKEVQEKMKTEEPPPAPEEAETGGGRPAMPGPPRGGLMDALKGARGGGRGGLMDAIQGGRGRGGGGGRGGLLDAISGAGRGRGGGRGGLLDAISSGARGRGRGPPGGGRGDLLGAIAGRGRGGGGDGGGGRGGLLDAIKGRGGRGPPAGGGRGGLLAAIAARGGDGD